MLAGLVFMKQNYFVVSTKHFAISIKFLLLKQNVLLRQQQKFCCINFFISVAENKIMLNQQNILLVQKKNVVAQIPTKYFCWIGKTGFSAYLQLYY